MGPATSLVTSNLMIPLLSIKLVVGLKPTKLLALAGILTDDPVSVPIPATARPAATPTAVPPDDPYDEYSKL